MKSKTRVTRSDDSSEALNNMVEIQRGLCRAKIGYAETIVEPGWAVGHLTDFVS